MPEIDLTALPKKSKAEPKITVRDNKEITSQILKDLGTFKIYNESYLRALSELPTMQPFVHSLENTLNSLNEVVEALLLSDRTDDQEMSNLRTAIYLRIKEALNE